MAWFSPVLGVEYFEIYQRPSLPILLISSKNPKRIKKKGEQK